MIESRSQTGQRRKMILSQSSAQSVASLPGAAETATKRIVPRRGSASGIDQPRSAPEAEPHLLKKNTTERKYNFLPGMIRDIGRLSPPSHSTTVAPTSQILHPK